MSQRGFSLVEVLVALGILALVLGIALPMLPSRASMREVEGTARQVAAAMRDARAAAVRLNRPVNFRVDVVHGVVGYDRPIQLVRKPDVRLTLTTTTELQDGVAAGVIRFYPEGGSSGGGVTVSTGGRRVVVEVDWLTGGVSLVADLRGEES